MNKIKAGDPLTQSADIVKQNIEMLKALFPTIAKEGKIDLEELKALLGEDVETGDEYYRFTWAGKAMARREANKPTTATLRPNKADSKDWDATQNIFIEGDNLEVLKMLQKSYANAIKMMYIDPPYNTGKDFVYKDDYADNLGNYLSLTGQTDEEGRKMSTNTESDGRFHSNWLNLMYPRLKLARTLLREDGIIFISLDDHEIHNLRKVCDEIFGEDNFVSCVTVRANPRGRQSDTYIATLHDYLLCYSKNTNVLELDGLPLTQGHL
jgi:adenine-specific DNA-methyltransferase